MKTTNPRSGAATRWRLLILDDHPITRYGLIQLINREPDLTVSGEAENAQEALGIIATDCPDLVLADITMPGKSGLDFIKEALGLHPGLFVLVVSMHDETVYAERVLRVGGRGYIMKSAGGEELLRAIRQVLSGQVYVSSSMSASLLNGFGRRHTPVCDARPGLLSDREFEVFGLIGEGWSTREISLRLSLSMKTIETHRLHIKQKLNLSTGAELMKQAVRWAATQQLV
jgi:DNA-binding NarL/FixJ family response regulator